MRSTLRRGILALCIAGGWAAILLGCGPSDLFIGLVQQDADRDSDVDTFADAGGLLDGPVVDHSVDAGHCMSFLDRPLDGAVVTLPPLEVPLCRSCAEARCCPELHACFDVSDTDAARATCDVYLECRGHCLDAATPDASVTSDAGILDSGEDGAADAAGSCLAACDALSSATAYAALEQCARTECPCTF